MAHRPAPAPEPEDEYDEEEEEYDEEEEFDEEVWASAGASLLRGSPGWCRTTT